MSSENPDVVKPRTYVSKIGDKSAVSLLTKMLGELMRLQERGRRMTRRPVPGAVKSDGTEGGDKDDSYKQDKDGRMTNNLDEYGVINLQLVQEILDLTCIMGELPVVYELKKRKLSLSKTLGKLFSVCCQDPEQR